MPVRIYDLAKKYGTTSMTVLRLAKELGITTGKVPSSTLDKLTAEFLEKHLPDALVELLYGGLRGLALQNFKAFADTQNVPIRPLTLIFGVNSSGKSSILHGLLLARHAIDTGKLDVSRTDIGGDSVDLGGFRQYVHRRDVSRRVELAIDLRANALRGNAADLLQGQKVIKVALSIGMPLNDLGEPEPGKAPRLMSYEVLAGGRSMLRLSRRPDDTMQLDRVDEASIASLFAAFVVSNSTTGSIEAQSDRDAVSAAMRSILNTLKFKCERFLPEQLIGEEFAKTQPLQMAPISRGNRAEELASLAQYFFPRAIGSIIENISTSLREQLQRVSYLGPLRSYPARHLAFAENEDRNWIAGGGFAWDIVRRNTEIREKINSWLSAPDRLQTPYKLELERYISPRRAEQAIGKAFWTVLQELETCTDYVIDTTDRQERPHIQFAQYDGDAKARDLIQHLLKMDNLERIDELVLTDQRTETTVSHRDVGIGVSQVLPVLVHAYANRGRIVAIEQPEVHLHPALQAELGDVFIESALGDQRNTFLLETHSEHLILRILRRVRETTNKTLPKGATPVRPEDIAVLFVEPTANGSVVRHMPVTPDGDFETPWPGGFFADRLQDLP